MTSAAPSEFSVRYEGPGSSTEIWGMTQANFSVGISGRHAKESAIQLNDAAAVYLATELGRPNTPENRQDLAAVAGAYILRSRAEAGGHIDSVIMVSVAFLQANPQVIEYIRSYRG